MLGGQSSNVTCSSGQVFGSARTLKADGISGFIWAFSSIESNQLSKKEEEIPPWCSSCEDCCSLFPSAFYQACCISCYHGDLAFCADWVDMFPLQYRQNTDLHILSAGFQCLWGFFPPSLSSSHASTKYYWMAIWLQSRGRCTRSTDVLKIRHHSLESSQLHWSSQDMSKWVECEVGSTLIGMFKCCPMLLLASFCLP